MPSRPLRVLFVLSKPGHLRKFEAALRELLRRGHQIHVAMPAQPLDYSMVVAERLAAESSGLRVTSDAPAFSNWWMRRAIGRACELILAVAHERRLLDERNQQPRRRSRVRSARGIVHRMFQQWPLRIPAVRRAAAGIVGGLDRLLGTVPAIRRYVERERPDVVLVSPLVHAPFLRGYVRAASRLGIPSALAVASWDNLSTKGPLLATPDYMIVWNDAQRLEAWHYHRYPPLQVIATGAHAFDDWFHAQPRARDVWCRRAGLDAASPYLLYLCSSRSIADDETVFVEAWIRALRGAADPRVRDLPVLVRPHPQNAAAWRHWRDVPGVIVSPRAGEDPIESAAKADFFDAMFHSVAVVGMNTSALIEAGIVGRPVLTVITPGPGQEATPHFHHLVDGGLLRTARTFEEHHQQIAEVLSAEGHVTMSPRAFLTSFVRPFGLEWDAGPIFAAAVERMAHTDGTR